MGRVERAEVAGPTATGIEFGIGGKQGRIATDAGIDAGFMVIPVLPGKRAFGCSMARDLVRQGIEFGTPLGIGFDDFAHRVTLHRGKKNQDEQLTASVPAQSGGAAA